MPNITPPISTPAPVTTAMTRERNSPNGIIGLLKRCS